MNSPDRPTSDRTEPDGRPQEETAQEFFPNPAIVGAALQSAGVGVWCWDIAAERVAWSSNLEAIHRLPAGSFDGSYASFEADIHPHDRPAVLAAIRGALRSGQPYRVRYRLPERAGFAECWVESKGTVEFKDGRPVYMLGLSYDITERVHLETELRNRIKQQEALAQLGERAVAEPDLERLLNDAVSTVAITLSVDLVKVLELLPGNSDLLLRAGFGWNVDLIGSVIAASTPGSHARYTLDSQLPVITEDLAAESRFNVDVYMRTHACVSGMDATIAGPDDRHYGILGVCSRSKRKFSGTEAAFLVAIANLLAGAIARRQLEQRNELMIREMRHRSGNLYSQLLALFSQTAKNSRSIADLANKYRARVLALANAERLITESGGKSIPLTDLLHGLLGPYIDRVSLSGPDVDLEPGSVFNLSAALHELADNAVKHGSLSSRKGTLELSWSLDRTERGLTLVLDWTEKNGPPARRPRRLGFGSRLIALVIDRQLNGEIVRSFTSKGLFVHMVVPLTHERWPTPLGENRAERP